MCLDHLRHVIDDGPNTPDNLRVLCQTCNSSRSTADRPFFVREGNIRWALDIDENDRSLFHEVIVGFRTPGGSGSDRNGNECWWGDDAWPWLDSITEPYKQWRSSKPRGQLVDSTDLPFSFIDVLSAITYDNPFGLPVFLVAVPKLLPVPTHYYRENVGAGWYVCNGEEGINCLPVDDDFPLGRIADKDLKSVAQVTASLVKHG